MKAPNNLSSKAKKAWKAIEDATTRDLSPADYAIIEQLCREMDIYDKAVKEIDKDGFTNKHGQISPAATIRNQAANNMRQAYRQINNFLEQEPKNKTLQNVQKNF